MLIDELVNGGKEWRGLHFVPALQEVDEFTHSLLLPGRERTHEICDVLGGHDLLAVYAVRRLPLRRPALGQIFCRRQRVDGLDLHVRLDSRALPVSL